MSKKRLVIVEDRLDRVANYVGELVKDGADIEKILIYRSEIEFNALANDFQGKPFFEKVQRVDSWNFFDILDGLHCNEDLLFLFDLCLESDAVEFSQKATVIYISEKVLPGHSSQCVRLPLDSSEATRFYVYTAQGEQAKERLAKWYPEHALDTSLTSDVMLLYKDNLAFCKAVGIKTR